MFVCQRLRVLVPSARSVATQWRFRRLQQSCTSVQGRKRAMKSGRPRRPRCVQTAGALGSRPLRLTTERAVAAPAGKFVFATDGDRQRIGYAVAIAGELKTVDPDAKVRRPRSPASEASVLEGSKPCVVFLRLF